MKLKLANFNYYGFDHKIVEDKFEGDLKYVGTFCVKGTYRPVAVYHNSAPNLLKGYKDYMLLWVDSTEDQLIVSGLSKEDMEEYRYQTGLKCKECGDLIYSIWRHDDRYCECGKCAIDGGRDYTRLTYETDSNYELVSIDLLKGETKEEEG